VTADALDAVIHRAVVPVLSRLQDEPQEIVVALVPNLVRVMLVAAVEVMAEERRQRS
jgi:hypothetical protein